jgi:hypothetical protein
MVWVSEIADPVPSVIYCYRYLSSTNIPVLVSLRTARSECGPGYSSPLPWALAISRLGPHLDPLRSKIAKNGSGRAEATNSQRRKPAA